MATLSPMRRRWLPVAAAVVVALSATLAAIVAFGVARPPPPLPSVAGVIAHLDLTGLPALSRYRTQDGGLLAYRAYPVAYPLVHPGADSAETQQVAILIHGSAGQSPGMHAVARTLNKTGAAVYALDVRGHGASGRRGDIDYIGQLDNDLADFVAHVRPAHPHAIWTLVGFSAGGAFALRIAGGPYGDLFDRYIAIAPALIFPKGVARPGNGSWATVSVPRIGGLIVLNLIGIHRFDGLNAVRYAAPPADTWFTHAYSYRLAMNFSPGLDYLSALARVKAPVAVLDGADDEQFYPDSYAALLKPMKPDIMVEVVPGVGHAGATTATAMLEAVSRTFKTMPQR